MFPTRFAELVPCINPGLLQPSLEIGHVPDTVLYMLIIISLWGFPVSYTIYLAPNIKIRVLFFQNETVSVL